MHTQEDPEGINYSSSQPEDKDGFLKFIVPHFPKPSPQLWGLYLELGTWAAGSKHLL